MCCMTQEGMALKTDGCDCSSDDEFMEADEASVSSWTPNDEDLELLGGAHGWFARGDRQPVEKRVPFNRPKLVQIYRALPFVVRYAKTWVKNYRNRDKLFINTFQPLRHKTTYGVPCGGLGTGCIGRDFRGGFCKFTLKPGLVEHNVVALKADQFILTVKKKDGTVTQTVLGVTDERTDKLSNWRFDVPEKKIVYRGLYPRSWTLYKLDNIGVSVVCRQMSPVIPGNYEDSCLPVTLFKFDIYNHTEEEIEAAITFAFRNGTGNKKTQAEGMCQSRAITTPDARGILLQHTVGGMETTYCLASPDVDNTTTGIFDPKEITCNFWSHLEATQNLDSLETNGKAQQLGIAVSTKSTIMPSEKTTTHFSLVWHMPVVHFTGGQRSYKRYYTKKFGLKSNAAFDIALYSLQNERIWEDAIEWWQRPILHEPNVPDWFKSALLNELYYLTDGGTVWFVYEDRWEEDEPHLSEYTRSAMKQFGRFAYLESWEYRMFNTYDVHFYASFALAELFPQLEYVVQCEMRDQINNHIPKQIRYHMEGDRAPVKSAKRIPHDLGNPADEPYLKVNAYVMHDTAKWKDLNLKFVLTSFRDYVLVAKRNPEFLRFIYPSVRELIDEGLEKWDRDGDSMIENFGAADQTYDAWKMSGVSAYCGSLWLASLCAAREMARAAGDEQNSAKFGDSLEKAKKVFDSVLWNGSYYNFDQTNTSNSTIMADQLCGYWYLQSVDPMLAKELLPQWHVDSALETIFNYNVVKFADCKLGAVNGMLPNGKVDRSYIQADEVWIGITYALASLFIQQNQLVKGFETAAGCYDTCFNRAGLQYQTPEALYRKRFYRAIGYMRPLAIWSMYASLKTQHGLFETAK